MKAGKGKYVLGSILIAVVTFYLVHPFALGAIGRHLVAEEAFKSADAIVVIGRDKTGERVEHAVRLFKQGLGKYLIISGRDIGWNTNEADMMKAHAINLGVPATLILTDRNGSTPEEQAEHVKDLLQLARLKSAVLVTSAHHSSRAKEAFSHAFSSLQLSVISAPVQPLFDPNSWWTTRKGVKIVFEEYWEWLWSDMEE